MKRKSQGNYPEDWSEIAKAVKDAAEWRCIRCGHAHEPGAGYTLDATSIKAVRYA